MYIEGTAVLCCKALGMVPDSSDSATAMPQPLLNTNNRLLQSSFSSTENPCVLYIQWKYLGPHTLLPLAKSRLAILHSCCLIGRAGSAVAISILKPQNPLCAAKVYPPVPLHTVTVDQGPLLQARGQATDSALGQEDSRCRKTLEDVYPLSGWSTT